jgi:beta-glucosidase
MTGKSERIEGLLQAMTLEEKLGQLTMIRADFGENGAELGAGKLDDIRAGRAGSVLDLKGAAQIGVGQKVASEESRLRIPLLFTLDVLHGYETIFPIPLGESAAFDPALWESTARAAAIEAAAEGIALTFAPMIDASRDPRWGRICESPGEDPWLGARFAEAKVRGFQQSDMAAPEAVAATAKHFAGYGAVTAGREYASADVSRRELWEVHLPPFAASIRAGAAAVMPAFIALSGAPLTAHRGMLRGVLREALGFEGVTISDFLAVRELIAHGVAADAVEAAALALNAGVDIDMASGVYLEGLPGAVARGLVRIEAIDEAVRRVLALKERLGLFEAPHARGSRKLGDAERAEHRALALEAARRSIVLLKNRDAILPLKGAAGRLAVVGPLADARSDMLGPWRASGDGDAAVSFLDGLRRALPDWSIAGGTGAMGDADIVLLCIGESASMCGEASSRARPGVPEDQRKLAEEVFRAGKPVAVALTCGRPLIAPWLFESADAVLATWFLGSEAGGALAEVLTGAVNPSGKLPVSWPYDAGQIPLYYAQRPSGRPAKADEHDSSKYLDAPVEPQFPFGHGLSYARFAYGEPRATPETVRAGDPILVEADIANEGAVAGEETALLFIRDPVASISRPLLELKGMARIRLEPGASGAVRFELSSDDLSFLDEEGRPHLEPGLIEIFVGPSADRALLKACRIHLAS